MKRWVYILCLLVSLLNAQNASGAIRLQDGQLYNTETPSIVSYKAVSMWYAPLLGASKDKRDKQRLIEELDALQQMGVNVVEVLAGAKVESVATKDSTQRAQGILLTLVDDKACFRGMDFLLSELKRRNMWAVVSLDRQTCFDQQRQQKYGQFVERWLTHKSSLTNVAYKDDANILAWKVCDECKIGSDSLQVYTTWTKECVRRIKQIDDNHLVIAAYAPLKQRDAEIDARSLSSFTAETGIDCAEVVLSPCEQGWINKGAIIEGLPHLFLQLDDRIAAYNREMRTTERPYTVCVQYPRDASFTRPGTSCGARETFYEYVGLKVGECRSEEESLIGWSIKGWGGQAQPNSLGVWDNIAQYTSEYPDEVKGQYSVFCADKQTIDVLTKQLKEE